MSRDETIELLAMRLNDAQLRLDPDGYSDWDEYDERDRDFFRSSVRFFLAERELLLDALAANDDLVDRPTTIRE